MQNWLKRSLLVLGVFGICWIGAVWYWRSTTRMPDTGDLALAMLVMPLTLITAFWLARKTFATLPVAVANGASARTSGGSTQATPEMHTAGTPAASNSPAAAAWQPFGIAGAALRMPHGDSPAELAAVLADGQARLDLDAELTDLQGFPLLAGRVPDVDLAAVEAWLASQHIAGRAPAAQHLRAMALGGEVAARLAARASAFESDGALQLILLLPPDWPDATRELATRCLQHSAGAVHARTTPTVAAALHELSAQTGSKAMPTLTMLLACDSSIDQEAVEHMAANGKLYGPRNPNGRMPAEGAAGILLQAPHTADDALRLLALQAESEAEADAPLTGLAQAAIEAGGGQPLAYIAADTDHRASVMADLMQCVDTAAPQLDTNTSLACIGAACGHTGATGAVAAIALAFAQASDSGGHALALANSDKNQRFALLVGPLPAAASKAPSLS